MSSKKQDGFSLIELMVVVSIMAILSVIGLGGFANAQKKARDSRRKADIKTIQNSMISSADTGGNMDARAAMAEMGGRFPEDPKKTGGVADEYLLVAPLNQSTIAEQEEFVTGLGETLQGGGSRNQISFVNSAEAFAAGIAQNSGLACAILESPNTGNVTAIGDNAAAKNGDALPPFQDWGFTASGDKKIDDNLSVEANGSGGISLTAEIASSEYTDKTVFCATF